MKEVFSTGEVAKFCHVTPKTVVNWIDSGKIRSMKTGGGFRKVFRKDLIAFLKENNIPLGELNESAKRILVIDDEPEVAELLKDYMEYEDEIYSFEIAENGEEGILKIGLFKPDLVILDIYMPEIDGFKVYDMVKSTKETERVEFIFMTGYSGNDIEDELTKRGIKHFLKKPLEKTETVKIISRAVAK